MSAWYGFEERFPTLQSVDRPFFKLVQGDFGSGRDGVEVQTLLVLLVFEGWLCKLSLLVVDVSSSLDIDPRCHVCAVDLSEWKMWTVFKLRSRERELTKALLLRRVDQSSSTRTRVSRTPLKTSHDPPGSNSTFCDNLNIIMASNSAFRIMQEKTSRPKVDYG